MFSRLSLSISALLLLFAVGGVARAASAPAHSGISAVESGIPDSMEFSKRTVSRHPRSNEEINAAETGNPDSVNYQQGVTSPSSKLTLPGLLLPLSTGYSGPVQVHNGQEERRRATEDRLPSILFPEE